MEQFTFGLDIATAISVIAAAAAFIWNSIVSARKERKERHKEIIKSYVFQVAEALYDESVVLFKEIGKIENKILEGEMTQNLNPFKIYVKQLPYIFKSRIDPLDKTYGDGRFAVLSSDYAEEMSEAINTLALVTSSEFEGNWNFEEVMHKPLRITETYIARMFLEAEKYIDEV